MHEPNIKSSRLMEGTPPSPPLSLSHTLKSMYVLFFMCRTGVKYGFMIASGMSCLPSYLLLLCVYGDPVLIRAGESYVILVKDL